MADLFTHVFTGYLFATLLSWHYDWITPALVTVAMAGAVLPDLNRISLLVPDWAVEAALGIPFSWSPLHRVGGTIIVILVGVLLVSRRLRRAAILMLGLGTATHYLLDFLLYKPSGLTSPLLWPITGQRFAVDGFYLSSDRWPALVLLSLVVVVWWLDRRRIGSRDSTFERTTR